MIEHLELGGAYRVVYLYHYFDEDAWVYTRLEFQRISEAEWMLSRVSFADRWANVVLATTPGFAPPQPPQSARRRR